MSKIFLDIGAWNGKSTEFFLKNRPDGKEFDIFMFECDKKNIEKIKNKNLNAILIEKAAWSSNGTQKYYYGLESGYDDGGSLYSTKITGGITPEQYYEIETIDLAEFIVDNFKKDDYIIIKMNCEGAEYELIPHLQKNNLINWIDKWYIQWHYHKIQLNKSTHENVVKMIPKSYEWECQLDDPNFIPKFKQSLNDE